jgi:RHS repeat-associated protein
VGNLSTVSDSHTPADGLSSTASFGYDNRNRLSSRTLAAATRHFKFDNLGNLTGRDLLASGDQPNQVYGHLDKPHAVTTAASGATYAYDADGNVIQRGSSYLTFDSQNRLVCEGPSPGCASADVTFAYDLDGRRLWQKTSSQTVVLFEDLADWDKTATDAALHVSAFGRRIATKSMTSPARRVAGPSVGGVELPLDPGWLVLAFASGGVLWLAVLAVRDGVPGRIRRHPVPAGIALLATASLALPPRAWAGGDPGPGTTFRRSLFHDHLGTNVLVTNPNGNPVRRRVFEPFGKVVAEDGSEAPQRLFTGQRHEPESGLYDFRARWYDPEAGRFLSVDPVVQSPSDPQTVNGYGYVRNNPVNLVDPDGRWVVLQGFHLGLGFPAASLPGVDFHPWNTTKMQSDALMSRGAFRNGGGSAVAKAVGNPVLGKAPARSSSDGRGGDGTGAPGSDGSDGVPGDPAGSALLGVPDRDGGSSRNAAQAHGPTADLAHAVEEGALFHVIDAMKVLANPMVVLGAGIGTTLIGGAVMAGAFAGGPVGAPAVAAGGFLVVIGLSEIDAGFAAMNVVYGTEIRVGPFSTSTARGGQ